MKGVVFILVVLTVASYAIDGRHPINGNIIPMASPAAKSGPALHRLSRDSRQPETRVPAPEAPEEFLDEASQNQDDVEGASSSSTASAASNGTEASSSTAPEHIKGTPGASCDTYTTCSTCTDYEALAFFCMWSKAYNICQEDTGFESAQHDQPEYDWTKQCEERPPFPIETCDGCPILAIDHKPKRHIIDSTIKGSDGEYSVATEGHLHVLGDNPHDPILGPITHPNGTNNPIYTLPSIRLDDGTIKDPIADQTKLTYSPCVGDDSCSSIASSFMTTSSKKGKIQPITVGSAEDVAERQQGLSKDNSAAVARLAAHPTHVDLVEMADAQVSDEVNDKDDMEDNVKEEAVDVDNTNTNTATIETNSRVVHRGVGDDSSSSPSSALEGGFTPTFSDDVAPSSDDISSSPSSPSSASDSTFSPSSSSTPFSSDDESPRFTESRRSETHGMSSAKSAAAGSSADTMEVTEFDDNVVGGQRVNEDGDDDDSTPTKEESQ